MNNALVTTDEQVKPDITVVLRKQQQDYLKIIGALQIVANSKEWQTLNELIFSKQLDKLKKQLEMESNKTELDSPEIYRLQGKIEWAKRYNDFYKLAETYRTELDNITKKLTKENNENGDAI